jgi:hypothetical protein
MTDETIAADLREFISSHIHTIAELEALLLLRASPGLVWDEIAAARRLYIPEPEAKSVMTRLHNQGLISFEDNGYRYAPANDKIGLVDRLAEAYARHLIPVTDLIHRKSRISEFADAFRLKKEN